MKKGLQNIKYYFYLCSPKTRKRSLDIFGIKGELEKKFMIY